MLPFRSLFVPLAVCIGAFPENALAQHQPPAAPTPNVKPHFGPVPPDSAAIRYSYFDGMPVLKPDLSKLAQMPVMKVDSLARFPMPNLELPRPGPSIPGKKDKNQTPKQ